MAVQQNFSLVAGSSKKLVFKIDDDAVPPLSLEGAAVRWWASRTKNDAPDAVSIKKENATAGGTGLTVTNAAEREFEVDLDPADTKALAGDYYHEVEIVDATSAVHRPIIGVMTVKVSLIARRPIAP